MAVDKTGTAPSERRTRWRLWPTWARSPRQREEDKVIMHMVWDLHRQLIAGSHLRVDSEYYYSTIGSGWCNQSLLEGMHPSRSEIGLKDIRYHSLVEDLDLTSVCSSFKYITVCFTTRASPSAELFAINIETERSKIGLGNLNSRTLGGGNSGWAAKTANVRPFVGPSNSGRSNRVHAS